MAYHPALMVGVWLYAYALGITSSRRLEQRIREDLAFGYLAAGAQPDHWTLNEFRRRHPRERKGFTLGYTATMAANEDHLIVEQRVSQEATDNDALVPMMEVIGAGDCGAGRSILCIGRCGRSCDFSWAGRSMGCARR